MRVRRVPYRESEERDDIPRPSAGEHDWLVRWEGGSEVVRAQTAREAWQKVPHAPHFSQCKVTDK